MSTKIILDCDPGHDDAVAIILSLGSPEIDLLGITTVGGNQTLEKVTYNARQVCTVVGKQAPIYAGCTRPLVRPVEVAESIHGETGMEIHNFELPTPTVDVEDKHAVDFIIETVMSHEPGTVTLVPTGPLTNIALAARKEPRIVERVKEVVLMGGGYHTGNWSAVAEFNIKIDPEAAHIVFNEPWPVTMVGLDLTHQALATAEVEEEIRQIGSTVSEFTVGLFGYFRQAYKDAQGFDDPPVHDPCTVAYLIDPTVFTTQKMPIDVELHGALTTGMTVADLRAPAPADCHTQAAVELDHRKFWDLVIRAIKELS
ncbi:nucleoside hydrolase [Corynebacterium sp. 153RC1]|uniref:uridine-preferring nucleoside hydrolase UriH n=1 Tax=unclassified Corynebacterium TaxID=2624378 RepID=UPI00211BA726|nr:MULTISPECIES: nucleoside hydrolase [unclassified Corynebacterium]MCQ9353187.1 nucleoside hydrolase [Corynebacterium sp. 209RC1]MCQ9355518.1 nucleoside hydrolase [Corynebacterium sp. 1222RC1]MCQ9357685.1 nucleoside hydrolase [Corynebacterium sp. 122RC1]MCQ9359892.1 nucleoside hydrolase [Corynebacterium sp. 142RC1]MCQ9362021.1 nucleoside hydrolase [Corynebacterium sp. 153RC1]